MSVSTTKTSVTTAEKQKTNPLGRAAAASTAYSRTQGPFFLPQRASVISGCVPPISVLVLRGLRARHRAAQQESGQTRKQTACNDHAFPNDSGGEHSRCRRAKRRKQQHQSCFADSNSALRNRHHGGNFC